MDDVVVELRDFPVVSMKSGLRDRNNVARSTSRIRDPAVSMKSGLRDRNNEYSKRLIHRIPKMIPVMALTVVWNVEYGRR